MRQLNNQIRWFYLLSALFACWFATGNWYFLWKLYLTNGQIGIFDSICFTAGMLVEIPSGAIADLFGRKKTLITACLLMAIGYTAMGLATSGGMILVTYLIFTIGFGFYSGADDALMYDRLIVDHQQDRWKEITATKNILARIAALIATGLGGYFFVLNDRLPAIVRGLFFLLMLIPLAKLPENYGRADIEKSFKKYGAHIWDGINQLSLPTIRHMLPVLVAVGSVTSTIYVGGLLRPLLLAEAGHGGEEQSYILAAVSIITVLLLLYFRKSWRFFSEHKLIWFLSGLTAICFVWLGALPASSWLFVLMLLQVIQGIFLPLTSEFINRQIGSSHRATALSSLSLLQNLPYVIVAPLIGAAADTRQFGSINLGILGILLVSMLLSGWMGYQKMR